MTDRQDHGSCGRRRQRPGRRLRTRLPALLLATSIGQLPRADVVFDGTLGPNAPGTLRAGAFEISQQDGVTAGGNLFHSFSRFAVNPGELATFTHQSAGIAHIVARVTGAAPTAINGGLQVRRSVDGTLSPTAAALWLMNPSGILIGDGASLDGQSTFVLSTANRLGFANGESLHSHGPIDSALLSVAPPAAFGFLDQQALPAEVTPRGITVSVSDAGNTNVPLFLSNLTLVGSSIDPLAAGIRFAGDIEQAVDASGFPPLDSTQFQAFNLQLGALAPGGSLQVDTATAPGLSALPGAPLGSIHLANSYLLISDEGVAPASGLTVLSEHLVMDNSHVDTFATARPVALALRATGSVALRDSVLLTSTGTAMDGGDIRIDTPRYAQSGGLLSTRTLNLGTSTGAPGNLLFGTSASLPMQSFLLERGQIQAFSGGENPAGDVFLNVRDSLTLRGAPEARVSLASVNGSTGASGDVLLFADSIRSEYSDIFSSGFNPDFGRFINLQAGTGGIELLNTSLFAVAGGGRTGASIGLISAGDIALASEGETSLIATGTSSDFRGGNIFIDAEGDLRVNGTFDFSSSSLGDASSLGAGGIVSLEGRNVHLLQPDTDALTSVSSLTRSAGDGGTIVVQAEESLVIRGRHEFASNTLGTGDAGAVLLDAASIDIESGVPTSLSTSSLGAGDAGIIALDAREQLQLSGVRIDSAALESGAAGFILMSGETIGIDNSSILTATRANDPTHVPAQIFIEAGGALQLSESTLLSNSVGASPAGQVSLSAGAALVVDNVTVQTATTAGGVTGGIFLDSGGDIDVRGENTLLLSNALGSSDAGDVNILAGDTLRFEGGGSVQTSSEGTGDAGTILLSADRVRLALARIEGTSENAGGGDINIFGRDIRLDGDVAAGGIVFITASSQSSDAAGNGGSVTLGNPLAPAELVLVRNTGISASAEAGNGGLININALQFLRDALSIFSVTSTLGDPGRFEINAPEQDISAAVSELDVAILDATRLIQDRCAVNPQDASSLVVGGEGGMAERYDGYLTSPFRAGSPGPAGQEVGADTALRDTRQGGLLLAGLRDECGWGLRQ